MAHGFIGPRGKWGTDGGVVFAAAWHRLGSMAHGFIGPGGKWGGPGGVGFVAAWPRLGSGGAGVGRHRRRRWIRGRLAQAWIDDAWVYRPGPGMERHRRRRWIRGRLALARIVGARVQVPRIADPLERMSDPRGRA